MKRNEIEGNQVTGSLCIKFLGPELPEPFGAITSYKTRISTFQVNISLETALLRDEGVYRMGRVMMLCLTIKLHPEDIKASSYEKSPFPTSKENAYMVL
jgi:hypothetical protein